MVNRPELHPHKICAQVQPIYGAHTHYWDSTQAIYKWQDQCFTPTLKQITLNHFFALYFCNIIKHLTNLSLSFKIYSIWKIWQQIFNLESFIKLCSSTIMEFHGQFLHSSFHFKKKKFSFHFSPKTHDINLEEF